jgi:hypothetical protein
LAAAVPAAFAVDKLRSLMAETLYCSFCGKSQREVRNLIVSPAVPGDPSKISELLYGDDIIDERLKLIENERQPPPRPEIVICNECVRVFVTIIGVDP